MDYSFEWDSAKEVENIAKHGIDFSTASLAFFDRDRIIATDALHAKDEDRYFCIGRTGENGKVATVRFTYRNGCIRIFGAGYWRKGKSLYENKEK